MCNHGTVRRGLAPLVLGLLTVAFMALPDVALADRGRVHLEDGSTIQGEIVSYDPGTGVTVQLANGSTIELSADDVARVEIGMDEPAPAAPAAAQAPATPRGPGYINAPTFAGPQSATPLVRALPPRPRLAGPLVLGSVGVLLVAIGAPMYTNSFSYHDTYQFTARGIAGATLMGMGGVLMISGFGIWLARRVKARRAWDADQGRALRLAPTLGRRHAGLHLLGTF